MSLDAAMTSEEILGWLLETDESSLATLWAAADRARQEHVGNAVHLRGLVEISSHCVRYCAYCGLRCGRPGPRYRMRDDEILATARLAAELGCGSVVLQAGEDPALTAERVAGFVRAIKDETGLAVTLSLGEQDERAWALWREAGADRYLLRFETSDRALYATIHPSRPDDAPVHRIEMLARLRALGYEVGSGVMVGVPGQTYATLAADVALFRELDLDMIGVGPYLAHPETPLGADPTRFVAADGEQVPEDAATALKVVALARLVCPEANIPATTALATIDRATGRELGLARGANVVMPNMTPLAYRALYEIYPGKENAHRAPRATMRGVLKRLAAIGRTPGTGPGGRLRGKARGPGSDTRTARRDARKESAR